MKKLLLVTAIGSALSLVGCGSGDEAPDTEQETVSVAPVRVVFDPTNGEVPVPSNILLSGSVDGTLNLPAEDPTDGADPFVAINSLDGWGTHSTLTFDFSLPLDENGERITLNASSVEAGGSVRVFETVMGRTPGTPEGCVDAPSPAVTCAVAAELEYGVDFIATANGEGNIAVIPLRPWKAKTGYMAVLTSGIEDSEGRSVRPSQTYALMKRPLAESPVSADPAAQSLQGLVNSQEAALEAAGVDAESVVYSSSFTTQSTTDVFDGVKLVLGQLANAGMPPAVVATTTGATVAQSLAASGVLEPGTQNYQIASAAELYTGSVNLPYFSPVPTADNQTAPLTGRWQAACDSPAAIISAVQAGELSVEELAGAGVDPAWLETTPERILEVCPDFDGIDEERHVTKFNPLPAVQTTDNAELWLSVPVAATANAVRASLGLDPISEPADGWPVVIFQHGITADRNSMLPIAGTLAVAGYATVAIDHPLHGDRGFGDINASDSQGGDVTAYMNLSSLATTRDNLRQSVADLLALRLGLNFDNVGLDGSNVRFVGHSLGAIAGTAFTAMANTSLGEDYEATLDPLFVTQAASLGMPGGSIANFLLASPSFGPVIKSQLLYAAEPAFATAVNDAAEATGTVPGSEAFSGLLISVYGEFMANLSAEQEAEVNATFEQFVFAAQTVVDSADPVNYASTVVANETPIHVLEVVGDGADSLPDQVIPNTVENKPIAGTEPLIALLGLPAVSETVTSEDGSPVSGAVRFTAGDHGSLVSPVASADVTTEMQQQIAFWFASGELQLPVTNTEVVLATDSE